MGPDKHIAIDRDKCRKKFLRFFRDGFKDHKYEAWERGYKWNAHVEWEKQLNQSEFTALLKTEKYDEIAKRAIGLETKTNLLFSFEKMALRDAVKGEGAKMFAEGLYDFIYGSDAANERFEKFTKVLQSLPRRQTRVLTWPLQTVFGFIARPDEFIFVKPQVTKEAAKNYDYDLDYKSQPNWHTYQSILSFAAQVRKDLKDLKPRDFIDLQSFIWVLGSSEYA